MGRIGRLLILFCFIYSFQIPFWHFGSAKLALAFSFYLFLFKSIRVPNSIRFFIALMVLNLIMSSIAPFVYSFNDFSFPYHLVVVLLEGVLGSILLKEIFYKSDFLYHDFLEDFVFCGVAQAVIIITMYSSKNFRDVLFSYCSIEEGKVFFHHTRFRGLGLAGAVHSPLSIVFGAQMTAIFLLFFRARMSFIKACFLGTFIFVGLVFTGRIGWVVPVLYLVFRIFHGLFRLGGFSRQELLVFTIIIISICTLSSLILVFDERVFPDVFKHAFEPLFNVVKNGHLKTASTNDLIENHLKFVRPDSWLLGTGGWTNEDGGYFARSDSGYVRLLTYGGVFWIVLFLMPFLSLLLFREKEREKKIAPGPSLFISYLVFLFIGNIKAPYFLLAMTIKPLFLFYVCSRANQKEKYKKVHMEGV